MKKIYLIETISMFRLRYGVEADNETDAAALVAAGGEDLIEMSQEHLGEIGSSCWEIDKDEFVQIWDDDNDYAKSWTVEKKLKYINKA